MHSGLRRRTWERLRVPTRPPERRCHRRRARGRTGRRGVRGLLRSRHGALPVSPRRDRRASACPLWDVRPRARLEVGQGREGRCFRPRVSSNSTPTVASSPSERVRSTRSDHPTRLDRSRIVLFGLVRCRRRELAVWLEAGSSRLRAWEPNGTGVRTLLERTPPTTCLVAVGSRASSAPRPMVALVRAMRSRSGTCSRRHRRNRGSAPPYGFRSWSRSVRAPNERRLRRGPSIEPERRHRRTARSVLHRESRFNLADVASERVRTIHRAGIRLDAGRPVPLLAESGAIDHRAKRATWCAFRSPSSMRSVSTSRSRGQ